MDCRVALGLKGCIALPRIFWRVLRGLGGLELDLGLKGLLGSVVYSGVGELGSGMPKAFSALQLIAREGLGSGLFVALRLKL